MQVHKVAVPQVDEAQELQGGAPGHERRQGLPGHAHVVEAEAAQVGEGEGGDALRDDDIVELQRMRLWVKRGENCAECPGKSAFRLLKCECFCHG